MKVGYGKISLRLYNEENDSVLLIRYGVIIIYLRYPTNVKRLNFNHFIMVIEG